MNDTLARLTNRPPRRATFTRPLDPNDATSVNKARERVKRTTAALDTAKAGDDATKTAAAQARHDEATAAYDAALAAVPTFEITVRAVPPWQAEQIVDAHPPTKEQITKAKAAANGDPKAVPPYNPDTFPAALLAAAIERIEISDGESEPVTSVTAEEVDAMIRDWSDGDQMALLVLAQTVSQSGSTIGVDLGKG